jgi:hypothetical protein
MILGWRPRGRWMLLGQGETGDIWDVGGMKGDVMVDAGK